MSEQIDMFGSANLGLSPRLIEQRASFFRSPAHRPATPVITLAGEQIAALDAIQAFRATAAPGAFLALHGLAGTGKTSVLAALARELVAEQRCSVMLAAPTGKAATVLGRKTGMAPTTLHRLLYTPDDRRRELAWIKRWEPGALSGSVVLVDEASMVDQQLAADLLETGVVTVASGDPAQLHPVQGTAFFTRPDFTLTEIRRQAADSPIIRQAHRVRGGLPYADDGDAFHIILERSDENYDWANIVLCYRNETRHSINRFLRRRQGIAPDALPRAGEPVICLKNDPFSGLMNGEVFTLADHYHPDHPLKLIDGPEIERAWFEPQRGEIKPPRGRTAFGLAYAITVHKAQGSEWPRVLIVDEFDGEYRDRWVYTAITRASAAVRIAPLTDAA